MYVNTLMDGNVEIFLFISIPSRAHYGLINMAIMSNYINKIFYVCVRLILIVKGV